MLEGISIPFSRDLPIALEQECDWMFDGFSLMETSNYKRKSEDGDDCKLGNSIKLLKISKTGEMEVDFLNLSLSLVVSPSDSIDNGGDMSDTSSLIHQIGRDNSIDSIARCSRSDYGSIALVNRSFRSLIEGKELYKLRQQIGIEEHWIYFSCSLLEWEVFDPIRLRWKHLPIMPSNDCFMHSDKESLAVGTELLVFGKGITSHLIYKYSLLTNSWSVGMEMNTPRCLQSSTNQVAQPTPATNIQAQVPLQAVQSVAPVQSGVMSTMARRFHWSHAVLAVGFLAISGAGTAIVFKNSLIPRLKSWIRGVVMDEDSHEEETDKKPSLAEEATAAAKAAAAAAADVAKASQELVISKNEEKERFADFMSLLEVQVQELRSMRSEMTRLEGKSHSGVRSNVREGYLDGSKARSVQPMGRNSEFDMRSVRSVSPPASAEPPHPKSYGEIMAMVQRGERPPNVREIDDQPPNPNQPISNPNLAPRAKPWEGGLPPNYENPAPWYDSWWKQKDRMAESRKMEDSNPVHERRWVPPQPPSVSMPEAAAAIRQAKSIPKDFNLGADKAPQPVEGLDELQRVTQLSETVGKLDLNVEGERSETFSSEIQEEQEEEQVTEM